jgi:hypothetical protein
MGAKPADQRTSDAGRRQSPQGRHQVGRLSLTQASSETQCFDRPNFVLSMVETRGCINKQPVSGGSWQRGRNDPGQIWRSPTGTVQWGVAQDVLLRGAMQAVVRMQAGRHAGRHCGGDSGCGPRR